MSTTDNGAAGSSRNTICLLTDKPAGWLHSLLLRCRVAHWSCGSVDAYVCDARAEGTLCIVVDLAVAPLTALTGLRERGVLAPAILCADRAIPPSSVAQASVLDVLEKPVDTRALLGWIGCVYAAKSVLDRQQARLSAVPAAMSPLRRFA